MKRTIFDVRSPALKRATCVFDCEWRMSNAPMSFTSFTSLMPRRPIHHLSLLIFHRAVYELVKADHDSVGVGEILHHSALDIELRKQMIVSGFVDVMILHHDVLHCGIGYHLAVGLTFIFLFRDFLELAPLALQLPKIIE